MPAIFMRELHNVGQAQKVVGAATTQVIGVSETFGHHAPQHLFAARMVGNRQREDLARFLPVVNGLRREGIFNLNFKGQGCQPLKKAPSLAHGSPCIHWVNRKTKAGRHIVRNRQQCVDGVTGAVGLHLHPR